MLYQYFDHKNLVYAEISNENAHWNSQHYITLVGGEK